MKIKMHHGGLAQSMSTVAEIEPTMDAVAEYLAAQGLPRHEVSPAQITVTSYGYDARIDWDAHLVKVVGMGVIAVTSGPVENQE
ncbi:hypothetical protein C4K26_2148 [Pseudomonas chlororaphis]|uniref:hypothetical protein n=1 Tax=Pseudomonas chlororaphis TaxID=587753 RepID=UPI000F577F0E|nr:hypothetical protein [Pseudomonas chlororaphis]AZD07551.1 hypothetical protein C4K26_2148 [Pseudomonas chlororaphis]